MKGQSGFILDLYSDRKGIVLWIITGERRLKLTYPFRPYFFIRPPEERFALALNKAFGRGLNIRGERGRDLREGEVEVLRVTAENPALYRKAQNFVRKSRIFMEAELYNVQIAPEQLFAFRKRLFPFGKVLLTGGEVVAADNASATDYDLPHLRIMKIKPITGQLNPKFLKHLPPFLIEFEGKELIFDGGDLSWLEKLIHREDPDLIISDFGDEVLLPAMARAGIRSLCRDGSKPEIRKGKSFMSYGEIVYRADSVFLKGRIHVDRMNSFFFSEVGLEGLIELARISGVSAQVLARTSVGTPLTAIEIRKAWEEGWLIPYRKNLPEDPKTALKLHQIDRGGLSFRPIPGLHENVAEYDFFSMYPSIIAGFNLSYETINCSHRECKVVLPFAGYRICTKREGIVPRVMRWLLSRRREYKRRLREAEGKERKSLDARQNALKWLLVVSFGYLGYKNAVFGRIESHEATTAIGRELLLFVKERAEEKGYRVLHALTDALWVYRKDATEEEYRKLEKQLNDELSTWLTPLNPKAEGFSLSLEGVYHWIVFCPSKEDGTGVPNRYYGKFSKGKIKARGIGIRRRDTPAFIRQFEEEALRILSRAENAGQFRKLMKEVMKLREEYVRKLREGRISPFDLIIYKKVTRKPEEYRHRCDTAEVVCTLAKEGFQIQPGDRIGILFTIKGYLPAVTYIFGNPSLPILDIDRYERFLKEDSLFEIIRETPLR